MNSKHTFFYLGFWRYILPSFDRVFVDGDEDQGRGQGCRDETAGRETAM